MPASDIHRVIDAVWRIESARVIGGLARIVRDVGVAEDLAQDALVAALKQWPESGVPDNPPPGSWAQRNTARSITCDAGSSSSASTASWRTRSNRASRRPTSRPTLDDDVGDDMLRLMFTACHPVLSAEARVALTLRMVGGLTTDEIARAFLVPEPTMAQRIVRAKKTLAAKRVPFELPKGDERRQRLASVLEVIYLIFNEGYAATSGADWMRARPVRGRVAAGAHGRGTRAGRSRGARPGRAAGNPGLAIAGEDRSRRPGDSAVGAEPVAMESVADSPRSGVDRTGGSARRAGAVRDPGQDCGVPRARPPRLPRRTGTGSSRCTTRCSRFCRRRSWR